MSTRLWIVHPVIAGKPASLRSEEGKLAEARSLASAIDLKVDRADMVRLPRVRASTLIGEGLLERLASDAREASSRPDLFLFNVALNAVQQRNLERALDAKVLDRTSLILEIFGARAETREGSLQVELAHLEWHRSRMVRSWTHLERQRGGYGFLGGPGESQLEIDRRLIAKRIARVKVELERLRVRRTLYRRHRKQPVVALVGYTSAGKTTLFNRLTGEHQLADAMPFATLDPRHRKLSLGPGRTAILSDTVGFISDLPTTLVAAFRATLEEVVLADLVIHVRDGAHPETSAQRADVHQVLETLGVKDEVSPPVIEALNKVDLMDSGGRDLLAGSGPGAVPVSALTGEGMDRLRDAIADHLFRGRRIVEVTVPAEDGATIAWLHRRGVVLDQENGRFRVELDPADRQRLHARLDSGMAGGKRLPELP